MGPTFFKCFLFFLNFCYRLSYYLQLIIVSGENGVNAVVMRWRRGRAASYEFTLRADVNNALLLVDVRQSLPDDLVDVTLVEVTQGHVEVTFFARKASWEVKDGGERVVLRCEKVNVTDGEWHRVQITRYEPQT